MKKNVLKALAQQYNLLPPLLKSILYFFVIAMQDHIGQPYESIVYLVDETIQDQDTEA
ncbi:MAG: hypothetical protein ACLTSL_06655 [Odoribacter splanchnicus]